MGYITDEHRNAMTFSAIDRWKKVDLKEPIKEFSQIDTNKPEELQSEFDDFDPNNSYPSSSFKGRNIMDLDFVYKQLLDGHKAIVLGIISKRKIDWSYKHFIPQLQYCNDGQNKHVRY